MYIDLYLPTETWKMINYFGDYNIVINYILKLSSVSGLFDVTDKPPAPPIDKVKYSHKRVEITDETFLELMTTYREKSSKISLRRLIVWFFDNEMTRYFYDADGNLPKSFTPKDYLSSENLRIQKIHKILDNLYKNLKMLHKFVANDNENVYYGSIKNAIDDFANQFVDKK